MRLASRKQSTHPLKKTFRHSIHFFISILLLLLAVNPAAIAQESGGETLIPELCVKPSFATSSDVIEVVDDSASVSDEPTATPSPTSEPTPEPTEEVPQPSPGPEVSQEPETTPAEEVIPEPVSLIEEDTYSCSLPVIDVRAVAGNNEITISWQPTDIEEVADAASPESFYVELLNQNRVIRVDSLTLSTVFSGLQNGVEYSFRVYSATENGSSAPSEIINAIPLSGMEGEVAGLIVEFVNDTAIVEGSSEVPGSELIKNVDLTIDTQLSDDVHLVEFSEAVSLTDAQEIADTLETDPNVLWAEPDQFVFTSSVNPNDTQYATSQWNLWDQYGVGIGSDNQNPTSAWSSDAGSGVTVAVIDTGITSHPDLDSQLVSGYDFVSNPESLSAVREENQLPVAFDGDYINSEEFGGLGWDNNPQDPGDWRGISPVRNSTWHGSFMAGVIAAQANNEEGIIGIAPGAKIQPIRALSWRGGLLSDIAAAITWASGGEVSGVELNQNISKVINMSFSVKSVCPVSLQNSINDAVARGSVLVAAAGNNNDDVKNYAPANCDNVISVGATNRDGKRAAYSNFGLGIDVSAPGGDTNSDGGIYSTSNEGLTSPASFGYTTQQGTSISAAHVSAIAARIFSTNPTFNSTEVKSQIINKNSVREFADTQCDINADIYCGEGIVSLFQVSAACSPAQKISDGYTYLVFTTVGTCSWTPGSEVSRIDSLLIAGGGAGGSGAWGGGGGAGEVVVYTQFTYTSGVPFNINVGAGGTPGSANLNPATNRSGNGSDTWLNNSSGVVAKGGGAGASYAYNESNSYTKGNAGGSGGGGTEHINNYNTGGLSTASSSGTRTGYGSDGGKGSTPGATQSGGGGGGAGGVGTAGGTKVGGNGGAGVSLSSWITPISTLMNIDWQTATNLGRIAGGGGGGTALTNSSSTPGTGGSGGGGRGANQSQDVLAGVSNTGSGGGGSSYTLHNTGGAGGSGLIVFKLTITAAPTITSASISGTQKIGSTLTASAGSTTGSISSTTYQWQYSADNSSWTNIPTSSTSQTYAISGTTYRANYLRVGVTVTNGGGSATAYSDPTALIYYPDCSPSTTTPTINGVVRNVYSFTNTGTCDWTIPDGVSKSNVLVIAGGGGGGGDEGGGGGAGGYLEQNAFDLTPGTRVTINVGAGGIAGTDNTASGGNGENSSFHTITATGGGGGGTSANSDVSDRVEVRKGKAGGSGGGGAGETPTNAGGSATPSGQGFAGGTGVSDRYFQGAGGGGASERGNKNYPTTSTYSHGGDGIASSITGSSVTRAGGGGGGAGNSSASSTYGGNPGLGGGGRGGGTDRVGTAGTANTGGGGGGGGAAGGALVGYAGGSGIVIVSLVSVAPTVSAISPSTGSTTSGGSVTITGTNFVSGQTTATINGISLTSISVSSSTTMTAVLPTLTVGTFDLVVNNGSGSATLSSAFTVIAAPTISGAAISGNTVVGETLTANPGTITGTSTTTTYQWQSAATSGGSYTNISGATNSTYVLTSSEATKFIKVVITVTNAGGSALATSNATTVIKTNCATDSSKYLSSTYLSADGITYNVRKFLSTSECMWVKPSNVTAANILVVGGGGGGGAHVGGGGGGGGVVETLGHSLSSATISVKVGAGGNGGYLFDPPCINPATPDGNEISSGNGCNSSLESNKARSGESSVFGSITVLGGGNGGHWNYFSPGSAATGGGSGNSAISPGTGTSGQGFAGGSYGSKTYSPGGGGGAGAVGSSGTSTASGNGGVGKSSSITGTDTFYGCGGGGGGHNSTDVVGSAGCSTAGVGSKATSVQAASGDANFGGGGGGSGSSNSNQSRGGNGGSGIVIISYASAPTVSSISPTSGAIPGDVSVTITGENFITGSTVTIGGVSLASVSVISGTSITGTISANSLTAGTKDVVVTTTSGTSTGGTGLYEGVNKSTPSLASISNISKTYGDSTFSINTPTATVSGSTIAGSVSYASSQLSVASVDGSTVTVVGVGTATFTATFTPTNTSLYNTTTTTFTITVAAKALTITADAKSKSFGGSTPINSYTLSTTLVGSDAISSLTYTYSGTNTITAPTAVGSYTITPSSVSFSTGSASNYLITYATGSYAIGLATQATLTVSSTSGTYGTPLTLTTSGGSGDGAVSYVAATGDASSCSVVGTTLTAGSGGTCLVTATKAASTSYLVASSVQTTVTFGKKDVTLSSFADISNKTYGDNSFTLSAPSVAGSVAGTFSYSSSATAVATISGSTVSIVGAGTSTITATFSPTNTTSYNNQTITMLLTINKKALTITAGDKSKVYATSAPANAFSSSTLVGSDAIASLTYTYSGTSTSTPPTVVGNYSITPSAASFGAGSADNYSITYVQGAFAVTKATPTFSGFNDVSKTYGDSTFSLSAPTVTGSVPGTFSYTSSDSSVVTISSSTVTVAGAGTSLITASFTPSDTTNYNSASTTMTITVAKSNQSTLTINSASSVNYGDTVSLTNSGGSSTGAVSFAVTSGTCSISGTTLTPGNAGSTCVIQATQAGDSNYNIVTSATQSITVNKLSQTITFGTTAPSSPVSGDTYTPTATSTSGFSPVITIDASASSICEINAGIITFNQSGSCVVNADVASSTNYNAATTATQTITVALISQTITFAQPADSSYGDANRSMSATASSGLSVTYATGAGTTNSSCSVTTSGVVSILATGNCEITVSQAGNSQYAVANAVSRTFAVNAIVPSAPFLTSVSASDSSATVSFSLPSSNGGANISAYEIVATPTSGTVVTKSDCSSSASPLACTITGLTNAVSYTFKVAAKNTAGTGAYSLSSGSFTPAGAAYAVTGLVAQPGNSTLIVNWDQITLAGLNGGSFTSYQIFYKTAVGGSYSLSADDTITAIGTTTKTFTGLVNGTAYDVKVVAITSANTTELVGNTSEVSQYPSTVPTAPTNVSATKLTATSARISWSVPLSDGGASLDASNPYLITVTGGLSCASVTTTSCDITGLTPAATYAISVKAQNRMGESVAGSTSYLVPSDDANLSSLGLQTGASLGSPAAATLSPSFSASTTSYAVSVVNTDVYSFITPVVNEATATIKINNVLVASGVAKTLALGIGSNVFNIVVTAGDLATTKTYTLTLTRVKAVQSALSITSVSSLNYGDTISLTTSGGSGTGLLSFTTSGTCSTTFAGGNYLLVPGDVGSSCSVTATKATDADYFVASSSAQTITVNKTTPALTGFGDIDKTYGDPSFTISEPSVSGAVAGSFVYSSSDTSVASVSGSTISLTGFGTSTIRATFSPVDGTNYNANITTLTITVAKKALRVTPADKTKFFGASNPSMTNSVIGLAGSEDIATINYTYEGTGSTTYTATTSNPVNAGTYSITPVITALTSGSLSNYNITYDTATLTISKVSQSALNIVSSTSAIYGQDLTLLISGGSGTGRVTFAKVTGDCRLNVSGSSYSIAPGDAGNTCEISASKAADDNHNAVNAINQTITIGKANQVLAFSSTASSTKVNDTYTPITTSKHSLSAVNTGITPTITIDVASAAICSISGGVIRFNAAGSCVINADATSSTNYNAATTASQTLTITIVVSTSSNNASSNAAPTPSPTSGLRPTRNIPIIRPVIKIPEKETENKPSLTNLPPVNSPELKPVFPSRNNSTLPNTANPGLIITDEVGRLPKSAPGEKQLAVDGVFVPVVETINADGVLSISIPQEVNVAPIQVSIESTDIKGQQIPVSTDGIIRAVKGQTITVAGEGLTPGSSFTAWLFSDPIKLGEGKVSADTRFDEVFIIPDNIEIGEHTLQINGVNSDKKVISLTTGVILTEVKQIENVSESNASIIGLGVVIIFILLLIIGLLSRNILNRSQRS